MPSSLAKLPKPALQAHLRVSGQNCGGIIKPLFYLQFGCFPA